MSHYVDGFVIPIAKDKIEEYRAIAEIAATVWKDHGALEYRECIGDDLNIEGMTSFPSMVKPGPEETILFSWIVYASREDRDRINAAVMQDPRLADSMDTSKMPFDCARMIYGGFKTLVEA